MKKENFIFRNPEGMNVFVYKWLPDYPSKVKAVVQIAHGYAETAERYERLGEALTDAGYIAYANDHRGHGKTANTLKRLGYPGDDCVNGMVKDLKQLNDIIKSEYPSLPIFLFGHSMGSMLSRMYITRYKGLKGLILSGTSWEVPALEMKMLAEKEAAESGMDSINERVFQASFVSINEAFKPARTPCDWLSRDTEEVDKYVNDPFCGIPFTNGFFVDFANSLMDINNDERLKNIPIDLPIYVFGGDKDPVGMFGLGVPATANAYNKLRIKDVSYKLYEGGRHEMLNEINRDEVTGDIIKWLDSHV